MAPPTPKTSHNMSNNSPDHHHHLDNPSSRWFLTCFGYPPAQIEPSNRSKATKIRNLGGDDDEEEIGKRKNKKKKRKLWKFSWPPVVRIRVMMKKSSSSMKRSKEIKEAGATKTRRRCVMRWAAGEVGVKDEKVGGGGEGLVISGGDERHEEEEIVISQQMPFTKVVVVEQTSRRPACFLGDGDVVDDVKPRDIIQQTAADSTTTTKIESNQEDTKMKQVKNDDRCSALPKRQVKEDFNNNKQQQHQSRKIKPKPADAAHHEYSDRKRSKRTRASAPDSSIETDSIIGMSILLVTLIVMVSCGRLYAVFCTAVCFYCVPWLIQRRANREAQLLLINSRKEDEKMMKNKLECSEEEYRKKVVLRGFLERSHNTNKHGAGLS